MARRKMAVSEKAPGKALGTEQRKRGAIDEGLKAQFLSEREGDKNVKATERKGGTACACCGKEITERNGVFAPKGVFISGYHPICLPCQQQYYAQTAAETSRTYALFYCCHAFNVPYKPSIMEDMVANQNGVWYEYVKHLQQGFTPDYANTRAETWLDGITDITEAFGGEFPVLPITGDVLVANMREMSDRDRWDIEWGENMPDEDCRNADDRYMMMTANRSGGTIPAIVNMYLHDAIRYMIARDKAEDSMEAKRYQEMTDKLMGSDPIKNWQSNKGETIRVDRIARYLESIGAMQNGYLVGYEDLVKILGAQHGNYNTSLDVVDSMMMCIINTMRKNQGEAELARLPLSAQVEDAKGELLAEMSKEEKKLMEGLGMKPPEREKVM